LTQLTLFGIKNCDTMKKAFRWLDEHGVDYRFHDYKIAGIDRAHVQRWCDALGWETVLNRSGTTFRKLAVAEKTDLDLGKAIVLMLAQPSMIKRPVLQTDHQLLIGFKPDAYQTLLGPRR
jgi:arsenate reductase